MTATIHLPIGLDSLDDKTANILHAAFKQARKDMRDSLHRAVPVLDKEDPTSYSNRPSRLASAARDVINLERQYDLLETIEDFFEAIPKRRIETAFRALLDYPVTFSVESEQVFWRTRDRRAQYVHKQTGETRSYAPYGDKEKWVETPYEELPIKTHWGDGQRVEFGGVHIGWILKNPSSTKFDCLPVGARIDEAPRAMGEGTGRQNAADGLAKQFCKRFRAAIATLVDHPEAERFRNLTDDR